MVNNARKRSRFENALTEKSLHHHVFVGDINRRSFFRLTKIEYKRLKTDVYGYALGFSGEEADPIEGCI